PNMKRGNLAVVTGAQVLNVELSGTRATGVRYRSRRGQEEVAQADRDVILAAGAIGSPQLLMLSGIGPPDHLREAGVEVAHDLPGVGKNPRDHPTRACI